MPTPSGCACWLRFRHPPPDAGLFGRRVDADDVADIPDLDADADYDDLAVPAAVDDHGATFRPDQASPDRDYICPRCRNPVFLRVIPDRRLHFVHRSRTAQATCADLRRQEIEHAKQEAWQRSEEERRAREAASAARAEQARIRSTAIDAEREHLRAVMAAHDAAFAAIQPTPEELALAAEARAREQQAELDRARIAHEVEEARLRDLRNRPPPPKRPDDMPADVPMAEYDERIDGVWREVIRRRRALGEAVYTSSGLSYLLDGLREAISEADGRPIRPEAAYAAAAVDAGDQARFRAAVEWALSVS